MNPDERFRRTADVRYRILDGEAVVVRQRAAEVLGLDAAGSRLLELLDGERTLRQVAQLLAEEFEATPGQIEVDVAEFVAELAAAGVVESAAGGR